MFAILFVFLFFPIVIGCIAGWIKSKVWVGVLGGVLTLIIELGLIFILMFYDSFKHEYRAKNPERIASYADFDLPDYDVVESDNNMERSASSYSAYDWQLKLKHPLTKEEISELDNLVEDDAEWSYDKQSRQYTYHVEGDSPYVNICIDVKTHTVDMEYEWEDW